MLVFFSFFTRAPISELANAWMAIMVRLVAVPRQFLIAATKVPPSSPRFWGEGKIHIFGVRIWPKFQVLRFVVAKRRKLSKIGNKLENQGYSGYISAKISQVPPFPLLRTRGSLWRGRRRPPHDIGEDMGAGSFSVIIQPTLTKFGGHIER